MALPISTRFPPVPNSAECICSQKHGGLARIRHSIWLDGHVRCLSNIGILESLRMICTFSSGVHQLYVTILNICRWYERVLRRGKSRAEEMFTFYYEENNVEGGRNGKANQSNITEATMSLPTRISLTFPFSLVSILPSIHHSYPFTIILLPPCLSISLTSRTASACTNVPVKD